jgi:hypothetical protein
MMRRSANYTNAPTASLPWEIEMPKRRVIQDGLVVGLIGYASVAFFYSAFDLLASRGTFYTVNLLGKALFRGLRDPGVLFYPMANDFTAIFWYNALHLAVALLIGVIVTSLVASAEQHPSRRGFVRLVLVLGFVATVMVAATLTTPIRPLLPLWSIVVANAFAAVLAGAYLLRRDQGLWGRLALSTG